MLADLTGAIVRSGTLTSDRRWGDEQLYLLLEFIVDQLPQWRDHPDRAPEAGERRLTSQLCAHLNSAAHRSQDWDILSFQIEDPDEARRNRSIDLSAHPRAATVWINGRRHTQFDMLIPIECKRLPTPDGADRDEREYVFSRYGTKGGIHRFKLGEHGQKHRLGGMIAYIQAESVDIWRRRVSGWIRELAKKDKAWSASECPQEIVRDEKRRLSHLRSRHHRADDLHDIELRHLWVVMDCEAAGES